MTTTPISPTGESRLAITTSSSAPFIPSLCNPGMTTCSRSWHLNKCEQNCHAPHSITLYFSILRFFTGKVHESVAVW